MSSNLASPYADETTAFNSSGGCLSGFLIPPLAVIAIGLVLAFLLLGPGTTSTLAAAGAAQTTIVQLETPTLASPAGPAGTGFQEQTQPSPIPIRAYSGPISAVFRPEIQYWSSAIQKWASAAGLDPNLVATVMQIESCGDPHALSRAGAIGLFQVMPDHFAGGDDPYSPDTNAARGLAYLKRSLAAANGDARLALAGYNGGIGVIGRSESSWAMETQRYAYWGSGIYAEASNDAITSLRLQEWMAAGGTSLCRQARSRLGISP